MLPVQNNPSFTIRSIAIEEYAESQLSRPRKNTCFKIVWVTKGECTCYIDLERHEIKNDTVYCISPGCMHFLQFSEECCGYEVAFSPEFLYLASENVGKAFYEEVLECVSGARAIGKAAEEEEMEAILRYMRREFDRYSLFRPAILSGWLKVFLSYLKGLARPSVPHSCPSKAIELVNTFYSMVEKNFLEKRMVADYANELSISPNYLNQIVKRVSGFSASYHIQQRIILEAKRLAIYSSASMKEIAYQLGFEEPPHFSKFFKNFSGTNFKDFKKNNLSHAVRISGVPAESPGV